MGQSCRREQRHVGCLAICGRSISCRRWRTGSCHSKCQSPLFLLWSPLPVPQQASNISLPNGSLELCYDELGHEYKIPTYCFTTPENVSSSKTVLEKLENVSKKTIVGKPLPLKIRVNPGDHNLQIDAETSNSIAELKRLVFEASVRVSHSPHFLRCSSYAMPRRLTNLIPT